MGLDDIYFPGGITADDLTQRGPTSVVPRNGTQGRVYGGACDLIHIADGKRSDAGKSVAHFIDTMMRAEAMANGARKPHEAMSQKLCPGCYMIALFNAAIKLAEDNGQPLEELGRSLGAAFDMLASPSRSYTYREEIEVLLDAD